MGVRKVTVNLPEDHVAFLQELASKRHVTVTEALRQAINTEWFLTGEESKGSKILIEAPTGEIKQIVRR